MKREREKPQEDRAAGWSTSDVLSQRKATVADTVAPAKQLSYRKISVLNLTASSQLLQLSEVKLRSPRWLSKSFARRLGQRCHPCSRQARGSGNQTATPEVAVWRSSDGYEDSSAEGTLRSRVRGERITPHVSVADPQPYNTDDHRCERKEGYTCLSPLSLSCRDRVAACMCVIG